jgi:dolichol kinase
MPLDRKLLKQEFERKLFHIAWAILPLFYYFGYPHDAMILLAFAVLIIWSGFEVSQKMGHHWLSDEQMREHERDGKLTGTFYQVLSLFIAVLFFDRTTAVLAMMFCCVGDSITGFAGAILYTMLGKGRTIIRDYSQVLLPLRPASLGIDLRYALCHRKSYLLMAVMFVACVIPGYVMYPDVRLAVVAVGAAGAVVADAFAWRIFGRTLNDDLTITLAAGGAISLLALL